MSFVTYLREFHTSRAMMADVIALADWRSSSGAPQAIVDMVVNAAAQRQGKAKNEVSRLGGSLAAADFKACVSKKTTSEGRETPCRMARPYGRHHLSSGDTILTWTPAGTVAVR
jgi:hypothetical protein